LSQVERQWNAERVSRRFLCAAGERRNHRSKRGSMEQQEDAWEQMWRGPTTKLERCAPWLALGLAALIAWIG
jgi:hypothetical protein